MIKLVSEDLEFMKFEQVFNKIIDEMKYINGENAVYKINDEAFEPIIYKDVCICASSLNSDLFHVLNRINKRTNGKYTLETILTIIKRYIDKDLNLEKLFRNKKRKTYSCSIQSKEFNLVKVQVTFERNNARDIFSSGIENCKYFCFIYTILDKEMQEKGTDIKLYVESKTIN